MSKTTPKTSAGRLESSTGDPTNPRQLPTTRLADISKETKHGTPTVKWQYRATIESSSVESRYSLDLLRQLADTLEAESLGLQLFHRHTGTGVQAWEITSASDPYSCCTSITGLSSRLTTLLISVTSENKTLLNHQDPLKDPMCRFSDKWSFYPDTFLGKRAGPIGIFSGTHPKSISWDSTAKTVSDITKKSINSNNHLQVTIKPIKLDYKDNGNV